MTPPAADGKGNPKAQQETSAGSGENTTGAAITDAARMAIPLGTAVVVGILLTLGLEGDARSRFIRDEPFRVFTPLALVIIGVTLPAVFAAVRAQQARNREASKDKSELSDPDKALVAFVFGIGFLLLGRLWADDFNWPDSVAFGFEIAGLALAVLAFALLLVPRFTHRLLTDIQTIGPEVAGSVLVLFGALLVAYWGTQAIAQREQPDIVVSAQQDSVNDQLVNIQVSGSGLSLRSRDKMLVRVMAVKSNVPSTIQEACRNPRKPGPAVVVKDGVLKTIDDAPGAKPVMLTEDATTRTLYWGETGPTSTGSTDMTVALQVSRVDYQWVCVYAALSAEEFVGPADATSSTPRLGLTIIDLDNAGPASPPTSSAPSTSDESETTGPAADE
ncbi:hypothetical protein [Williamsia soli]|uniref:hypothetical protein n=1 Tax=Williamsia soli TaxID=364929 RepID=UPI001A9EDF57|nr:hypothetical protein [Williamsia soli]